LRSPFLVKEKKKKKKKKEKGKEKGGKGKEKKGKDLIYGDPRAPAQRIVLT